MSVKRFRPGRGSASVSRIKSTVRRRDRVSWLIINENNTSSGDPIHSGNNHKINSKPISPSVTGPAGRHHKAKTIPTSWANIIQAKAAGKVQPVSVVSRATF
jgi:hypothetical protein